MSKIGRNDPCPCGSGKKYKRCCGLGDPDAAIIEAAHRFSEGPPPPGFSPGQTFMESQGMPNLATEELHRLGSLMEGLSFESEAELNAFLQQALVSQNSAPQEDFLGLSAEDLHGIFENPKKACMALVDFPGPITADDTQAIPILRQASFLLERLRQAPLDLTQSGTLKPTFIKAWYEASCGIFETPEIRAILSPRYQADCPELARIRDICEAARLCEAGTKQLCLTPKGQKLAENPDRIGLYKELFLGYLRSYADRHSELNYRVPEIAQEGLLFGLYLIHRLARPEVEKMELGRVFFKAFFHDEEEDEMALSLLASSACVLPARNLGLLEEESLYDADNDSRKVRLSKLYPRLVRWKK